ncbi:DUF4367 domain-containing protein [Lacrimispora sp. NSJ-141]|uniref:DUF4367 domain-containing protein n=1 Tax=Lientehia hominis TaxID=2897778 RepID=A0AAP2RGY4_9FIRM|nr:DUF4367 domain-containing protein [Lientehia hominis]MCD2491782.1 DUF4367 domain-containing protein [Lientehia hominis]
MRKPERGLIKKPDESSARNSGNEIEGRRGGDSGQDDLETELENLIKAAVKEEDEERWEAIQKELEDEGPFEYSAEEEKEMEARIAHIRKRRKKAARKEKKKKSHVLRVIAASAAVLVLVVVVQSAIVKSVDASIETVVDVVVKWFEDHVEVKNEVSEYWIVNYNVKEPGFIPEDYELIKEDDTPISRIWEYASKDDKKIIVSYTLILEGTKEGYNSEIFDKEEIMIRNKEVELWKSDEYGNILHWNSDVISYKIEADLSVEEMKKIAESILFE